MKLKQILQKEATLSNDAPRLEVQTKLDRLKELNVNFEKVVEFLMRDMLEPELALDLFSQIEDEFNVNLTTPVKKTRGASKTDPFSPTHGW